ncbi:hypothetical protein DM860_015018 [Cuscuta australis]|uniref:Uncharacterized protein n=1 Tax=Cuscuta australis TaxID=267555 RepID=A0A328DED1_9ASTE|nr:hypothetical protein DM860_015018 [Cuscuta australis]
MEQIARRITGLSAQIQATRTRGNYVLIFNMLFIVAVFQPWCDVNSTDAGIYKIRWIMMLR